MGVSFAAKMYTQKLQSLLQKEIRIGCFLFFVFFCIQIRHMFVGIVVRLYRTPETLGDQVTKGKWPISTILIRFEVKPFELTEPCIYLNNFGFFMWKSMGKLLLVGALERHASSTTL